MINWMTELLTNKHVQIYRLIEGLGRAGFVFGALEWERPFLSPLYTFASLHHPRAVKPIPVYALLALRYLVQRIKARRYYPCAEQRRAWPSAPRVDARATGSTIGIGGWEPFARPDGSIDKARSRWFMLELDPVTAP